MTALDPHEEPGPCQDFTSLCGSVGYVFFVFLGYHPKFLRKLQSCNYSVCVFTKIGASFGGRGLRERSQKRDFLLPKTVGREHKKFI